MTFRLSAAFVVVISFVGSATASTIPFAELNFDANVNVTGVVSNQDPTLFPAGDMANMGNRTVLQPNGFGLPFAITDDSVTPAMGNSVFPADSNAVVGEAKTDNFFGVVDTINPSANPDVAVIEWTFDIAGNPVCRIDLDAGAMGDFEGPEAASMFGAVEDFYRFEILIDGVLFGTIFEARANEDLAQTYRAFDNGAIFTLDDPLVDIVSGTVLNKADAVSGAMDTFSVLLPFLTGSELTLRFTAETDGGSEAFAFDNVVLYTIPEPTSVALAGIGLAGIGLVALRRRRNG